MPYFCHSTKRVHYEECNNIISLCSRNLNGGLLRDITVKDRSERDDGTVVKRERRIDDDGITIEKRKRDKEIFDKDEDDRDTKVRIGKAKNDDDGGIEIRREEK